MAAQPRLAPARKRPVAASPSEYMPPNVDLWIYLRVDGSVLVSEPFPGVPGRSPQRPVADLICARLSLVIVAMSCRAPARARAGARGRFLIR